MTVRQLLDRVDSRELTDWEAYDRLEPVGERMTQLMVGQLTATITNLLKQKGKKDVTAEELMPRWVEAEDGEQDWRAWRRQLEIMTKAMKTETKKEAKHGG